MNNTKHPKYPHQRAELRRNNIDPRGIKERQQMETQAMRISIGTFNIFPPKPDTEVSSFTLAFTESIPKHKLYPLLFEMLEHHWDGEPTRSIFIHLSTPIPLKELRNKINNKFADLVHT